MESSEQGPRDDGAPSPAVMAIVTITKGDPAGIRKTVASVAEQDFARYEHVVIDGGSGVDVAAWLASWQREMPKQRLLVDKPPAGIYPAMNTGIESTSAPLVLILNGGDELTPGALRRVFEDFTTYRWRWAYGGLQGRDQEGRLQDEYPAAPFSSVALRAGLKPVPHQATYVTRALYDEVGLYREDLGSAADQEFFLRVSRIAEPRQISGILAVVETWGLSNQETFLGREVTWHRLRMASGTAFGGHSATDLIVTALLLGRLFLKRIVPKLRNLLSS